MNIPILTEKTVKNYIGIRPKNSSKRNFGKALLIAGSPGFSGAALMSACAALRCGAGTLKVAVPASVKGALYRLPEAMCEVYPREDWDEGAQVFLEGLVSGSTAVAIGPGLGRGSGRGQMIRAAVKSGLPTVIDADGLYALSLENNIGDILGPNVVITPHFAEMARLVKCPVEEVAAGQGQLALEYARRWNCTVLLKGAESVIASYDGRIAKNTTGNPGLAKGGSGDVLTGLVLGFLAQKLNPFEAACSGAYMLGASADRALELLRERFLMAGDVIDMINLTIENTLNREE